MADEIGSGPQNHGLRVKVSKGVLAPESPGEQNGKGDFIELYPV